jgi:hypothetical protein
MKKSFREDRKGTFIVASGWLFADMLLALAMLFLVSNTIGIHPPVPTPTPTSTHVPTAAAASPTPIPTPAPHLEQKPHRFSINIDANALLSGNQSSSDAVVRQITAQPFLRGRKAGLAIVYGGAPDDTQISIADDIANKIYAIFHNLGKRNAGFTNIASYDPLYLLGGDLNKVVIDIFLFAN